MSRSTPPRDDDPVLFDLPLHAEEPGAPRRRRRAGRDDEPPAADAGDLSAEESETLPLAGNVARPRAERAAERPAPRPLPPPPPARPSAPGPADEILPAEPRRAPLARRWLAGTVDLGITAAVLATALIGLALLGLPLRSALAAPLALFLLAFSFVYHLVPLAFWGRTPGMAAARIYARSPDGQPLSFGQAARRWLAAVLTVALLGLPLLVGLAGRGLADRLSGTLTRQRAPRLGR